MKNSIILAGAAALAFTAPVLAQPGKGGGNGGGNGGGQQQARGGGNGGGQQARGGGQQQQQARGNGNRGGQQQARGGGQQQQARGNGRQQQQARGNGQQQQVRGNGQQQQQARGNGRQQQQQARGNGQQQQLARGNGNRGSQQQARGNGQQQQARSNGRQQQARGNGRQQQQQQQARGNGQQQQLARGNSQQRAERGRGQAETRVAVNERLNSAPAFRTEQRLAYVASPSFRSTGLIDGCPPGLAAKNNGCLPPGQARRLVGAAVPAVLGSALLPPLYRSWYPDNDDYNYRTREGYVYRVAREQNIIDAYWPLADQWNGAYYVGAAYPQDYLGYYNVPVQYQPWYADNNDYYYRYGDGAIYQVDRRGGVIESIVSLLAGGFGIGQAMPAGYDVYNVPYEYRDRYVDGPDSWYRYNDGYIYQVDPTTRIVQAIVETLV